MADIGRQSPLSVNILGSILQNAGLVINPVAESFMGASKTNETYTPGTLLNLTSLKFLTYAINDAYNKGQPKSILPNNTTVAVSNLLIGLSYQILAFSNDTLPATALTIGTVYKITSVGNTDFTKVGASANTVGVVFTATGIGIGTGTVSYNKILPATSIVPGKLYQIDTKGNSDFTTVGSINNTVGTIFTAIGVPTGTGTVVEITDFTKVGATSVSAGNFVPGKKYIIFTLGSTNFTTIGAGANTVGTIFTATGQGTGTGVAITVNFVATGTTTGTGTVATVSNLTTTTYNKLISIGSETLPALGNSLPPTYVAVDPAGVWARTSLDSTTPCASEIYGSQQGVNPSLPGPATSGYGITSNTGQGQEASWYPYTGDSTLNPNTGITQWGFIRLLALQAWNEFNWNGTIPNQDSPEFKEFLSSFTTTYGFLSDSNQSIHVIENANSFLDGVYSNMNDLTSADISGVCLSGIDFGTDLENLGNVLDLSRIETFGMPSNLLMSIGKSGAMTQDLGLALLAAGLSKDDITSITSGTIPNWSKTLEQNIFGAFLIITGENLTNILAPLQCKTQGLETLADLLNLQKLFPISYSALTVPVYNAALDLPTNSKTYYLIYQNGGINPALNTPEIQDYVGTIIPKGIPPVSANTVAPENFVELPKGYGSYLDGIIPADWATAAGAFAYSMRQITNIENIKFDVFARVAKGIENMADLPLVAGTAKPTNQNAIDNSQQICSLGSGPAGSYTMSDFFGCMSGLPYPWELVQQRLNQLDTDTLYDIYRELFLAVTWEPAQVTVQYTGTGPYTVTGLTISNPGGGYGRGVAPAPTITLSNGGTATLTIGTDETDIGSLGQGTYGRVINVQLTNPGSSSGSIPTASIQCPPTSTLGGSNTPASTTGWPSPMDSVVDNYIFLAESEIQSILDNNPEESFYLTTYWNILGSQLAREQRARYTCLSPVSVPKDPFTNQYPNTAYNFLDSIPSFAQNTRPHMTAQTLEVISDFTTLGGQSIIAKMREERNQSRLQQLGTVLDNSIDNTLSPTAERTLLANGTVPGALNGIESPNGNIYTLPAWTNTDPSGYYDPNIGFVQTGATNNGDITPIINGDPNPVVNSVVPAGPAITQPGNDIVIIAPPDEYNPANLPPNLDPNYTNSTLKPGTLSIRRAIDKVIECNCDCWVK
jgi:hypothetical protein